MKPIYHCRRCGFVSTRHSEYHPPSLSGKEICKECAIARRYEIEDALEELTQVARERMCAATEDMIGLRPAECDWMTEEEHARMQALQLEYISVAETTEEIRARVARKRAARREAMHGTSGSSAIGVDGADPE